MKWLPVLLANIAYLIAALFLFSSRKNYEFLIYVGVIIFFLLLILFTQKRINLSSRTLWGLTLWGMLHMAGGGIFIRGTRLYEIILIPLSSTYPIFRYDQLVHIIGFGVATFVMWELLKPLLRPTPAWIRIGIVVIMAGLGAGALNEIIEFAATVIVPETGVGGYMNTALDLVANLIGALIAFFLIYIIEKKPARNQTIYQH